MLRVAIGTVTEEEASLPPPTPSQRCNCHRTLDLILQTPSPGKGNRKEVKLCVDEPTRWKRRLGRKLVDWEIWEACYGRSRISEEGY